VCVCVCVCVQDVAEHDADELKKAMAGLGTNEGTLIRTLAFKSNNHLRNVNATFTRKYGTKGNLIKWIEGQSVFAKTFSIFIV